MQSSDGSSVSYVPVLASDSEKVDYLYEIANPVSSWSGWTTVTDFTHSGPTNYRVTATLKTSTDPAVNYANNYILRFTAPDTNPYQFTLDGSMDGIGVLVNVGSTSVTPKQISTNSSAYTKFKYNGEAYTAVPSIFSNHPTDPLTEANNIVVTYRAR